MLRIRIDGVKATVVENETLTAGRVGLECAFEFAGGDWGDLLKVAVFEGVETVDVALVGGSCIVPWESLAIEGVQLKVGVYGANGAGTIVIPTVWANVGKIQPSANPSGNEPDTPSQNLIAYAVETANEAKTLAEGVKTDADNGDFDGSQLWKSSAAPTSGGGVYTFDSGNLSGDPNMNPAVGDIVFYSYYYYNVTSISGTNVICGTRTSIRGSSGSAGQGVPTGGSTGQVLKKLSGTDYDTGWANESGGGGGGGTPYTSNPAMDGTAYPGSSDDYARGDHVHPSDTSRQAKITASGILKGDGNGGVSAAVAGTDYLASAPVSSVNSKTGVVSLAASDVGAIAAPASPSDSDLLAYTHGAWAAVSPSIIVPAAATNTPANLGTAAVGTSLKFAKEDHVHAMPSAANVGAIAAPVSPSSGDVLSYSGSAWAASAPHYVPAGGNLGAMLAKNSGSDYDYTWRTVLDYTPAGVITTGAGAAAKIATYSFWDDTHYPQILYVTLGLANTAASALTLKVNGKGPYPIYINGTASSATNYTLPAGSYLVYFDGTNFYFDTTGKIPSAMLPVYNGGVS